MELTALAANVFTKLTVNHDLAKSARYFGNNAFGLITPEPIVLCHCVKLIFSNNSMQMERLTLPG